MRTGGRELEKTAQVKRTTLASIAGEDGKGYSGTFTPEMARGLEGLPFEEARRTAILAVEAHVAAHPKTLQKNVDGHMKAIKEARDSEKLISSVWGFILAAQGLKVI